MSLQFPYRLKQSDEIFGRETVRVVSLHDLNETIDLVFAELERTGTPERLEELCPYFGAVWPSARGLAEVLESEWRARLPGVSILEIGCGLAIPSLLASRLGARVVATDSHPDVPAFLEKNLALNPDTRVEYRRLDWLKLDPGLREKFPLVMGSDILYERQHPSLVAQALIQYLEPGGKLLIADPARPYLQPFVEEMRRRGFVETLQVKKVPDHPTPKEVFVIEFRSA